MEKIGEIYYDFAGWNHGIVCSLSVLIILSEDQLFKITIKFKHMICNIFKTSVLTFYLRNEINAKFLTFHRYVISSTPQF